MNSPCLFCLEVVGKDTLANPIGCHCKLYAHTSCFEQWFQEKNQMECPICHTISIPNQIAIDNIRVVFVDTTNATLQIRRNTLFSKQGKIAAVCCCLFLFIGWSLGSTILSYQNN